MTDIFKETLKELVKKRGEKRVTNPNKTIKIEIDFWTNALASGPSKVIPKTCWDFGMIHILENRAHGIEREKPIPFQSLSEIESKIEKSFQRVGIKMIKHRDVYYP